MKSLSTRSRFVTGLLLANLALSPVAVLSDLSLVRCMQRIASGELVDDAEADEIDNRQAIIGLVGLGLACASAVAFLMWFHRAHKNLRAAGLRHTRYASG